MLSTISFEHLKSVSLYFFPLEPFTDLTAFGEDTRANLATIYDYERVTDEEWKFYIDVFLRYPGVAKTHTRSSFMVTATEEQLFEKDVLEAAVKWAMTACLRSFREQCEVHKLEIAEIDEKLLASVPEVTETFIDQYYAYRKSQYLNNRSLMTTAMVLSPGRLTSLAVLCTFKIMDEVLFCNPLFDDKSNQQKLQGIIPLNKYVTLKLKGLNIQQEEVQFTLIDMTFLAVLMDAALQMVVGEHFDKLQESLDEGGFTAEKIQEYIKFCSEMLRAFKANLEKCGSRIINLEVQYDWNAMIT